MLNTPKLPYVKHVSNSITYPLDCFEDLHNWTLEDIENMEIAANRRNYYDNQP